MANGTPSGLRVGHLLNVGSQRRRTWEPQQRTRRRTTSVVCLSLWRPTRSESFSERQTYRPVTWKSLDVCIRTPGGSSRRVVGEERMQVWELVAPLVAELRLYEPKLYMAASGAPVNESASARLLAGEDLVLEEGKLQWDTRSANDIRLRIIEELLASEKDYCQTLRTVCDLYEKPLRKLLSLEKEDYKWFFDWVDPICSLSRMVVMKLKVAVDEWDSYETRVGNIFSKLLWNKYEEYQNMFKVTTLPLLREKQSADDDFVALCQLRQGAAKYSLEGLLHLPLERLVQYERYLSLLAEQTASDHPDYNDICRTARKAASMVKRADTGREESDLDRIQDLFPSDHLRLHERDPLSPRKGLIRSKSSAAYKIQKAMPGKCKSPPAGEGPNIHHPRLEPLSPQKKHLWGDDNFRVFIMESPVNFTMGVQKQERHLFLFNDLMLIAKPRSGGMYKLKEKVRMCEMWLSQCIGDVCESIKSPSTSFVIGWPTTNVVVTFSSLKTKDLWQEKLQQLVDEAKEKEGKILTSVQFSYRNPDTNEELCKTIKVDNRHTAQECIRLLLQQLGQPEITIKDFKLWVKTGKDDSPYPLIGHEYPFSIKMNFIRELLRRSDLDLRNFNNISTDAKCYFILRKNSLNSSIRADPRSTKKRKKHRRPHHKINWLFRRQGAKQDSVDSGSGSPPPSSLFGQPLWKLCPENNIPKPIMSMLVQLFKHGPFTVGIFRKSANARACRELKEKLEAEPDCDLRSISVIVLASVFKEFLRSLPDCLLQSELYKQWLQAVSIESDWECRKHVLSLLGQLPPINVQLLKYTLCVLWHIAQQASENKMSSSNLAVCIGPSLLNPGSLQSPALQQEDVTKRVPRMVAYLIDHCPDLFGDHILRLLGPFPERDSSRQDSGAEESDSLHSLQDLGGHYRRDDSSIDSLDRDFLDESEPSPKLPCKSKMSLTNLSRDSGLTLSDTQLYTPEEEAESEASSGDGRRGNATALTKSVPHLDSAGLDNSSVMYGKNAGVSIDGSCHDVVRKRRQGMETHRTKPLLANCHSLSFPHSDIHYDGSPHLPLQLSQSYSYSMQQDLICRSYNSSRSVEQHVKRREIRGRSCHGRPIMSALEPVEDYVNTTLRRSASEESLLQSYASSSASKRLLSQRKRRAPSPPSSKTVSQSSSHTKEQETIHNLAQDLSTCSLSPTTPDRHALWFAAHARKVDWKRSQSTSKIDEIDQAHDSSTLSLVSSEESTPQVSRSNSRVQELSSQSHSDLYGIYYSPPRVNSVCSSTSDGSQQSQTSRCSQSSNKSSESCRSQRSNCSVNGSSPAKPSEPPSYLEAINRQTMLRQLQKPVVKHVTEEMRAEQTSLSAKARELYENSLRLYAQQIPETEETHHAVPVKVDSVDEVRKTQVAAKATQTSQRPVNDGSHTRLRHLPPVHVTDAQLDQVRNINIRSRQPRDDLPDDLRKEISWSVAQLRALFSPPPQQENNSHYYSAHTQKNEEDLSSGRHTSRHILHTRTRSLSTRSEEESFV